MDRSKGEFAAELLPTNKFVEANRRIVEFEIRPGNTVTFIHEVELTEIEQIRAEAKPKGFAKPSYTAFVAKAVALALREFPYANRRLCRRGWLPFSNPRLQQFTSCDVAIAVEREVPGAESVAFVDILRNADRRPLDEMTGWLRQLGDCDEKSNPQWRDFSWLIKRLPLWLSTWLIRLPYISPGAWTKYRGGAVLISSPAKYGVDGVVATWSWPLGLSFGLVRPRPMVRNDQVVACPGFLLSLNFDRRIMAGAQAARFFNRIVELLERARSLMGDHLPATSNSAALQYTGSTVGTSATKEQ